MDWAKAVVSFCPKARQKVRDATSAIPGERYLPPDIVPGPAFRADEDDTVHFGSRLERNGFVRVDIDKRCVEAKFVPAHRADAELVLHPDSFDLTNLGHGDH